MIYHLLIHTDPDSLNTICDICGISIRRDKLERHKNGILCLYQKDIAYKWEDIGKRIAEILLFGQKWQWKPNIFLDKLQLSIQVNQQSIIPEIVIYKDENIDTIIDLKSSIYSLSDKDINIYPFVAKKVIFWILKGDSSIVEHKGHILQFVSSNNLIELLTRQIILKMNKNQSIQSLINDIQKLICIP